MCQLLCVLKRSELLTRDSVLSCAASVYIVFEAYAYTCCLSLQCVLLLCTNHCRSKQR
jgi:hypothetical protein